MVVLFLKLVFRVIGLNFRCVKEDNHTEDEKGVSVVSVSTKRSERFQSFSKMTDSLKIVHCIRTHRFISFCAKSIVVLLSLVALFYLFGDNTVGQNGTKHNLRGHLSNMISGKNKILTNPTEMGIWELIVTCYIDSVAYPETRLYENRTERPFRYAATINNVSWWHHHKWNRWFNSTTTRTSMARE